MPDTTPVEFEIRDDGPPPARRSCALSPLGAALRQLKPNQSFWVASSQTAVSSYVAQAKRTTGHHYTTRREAGGTRIYCVAKAEG